MSAAAHGADAGGTSVAVDPVLLHGREIRTGRRFQIGREVRELRRLRAATVALVVLALLGAPLGIQLVREATRDPVVVDLNALDVPRWARVDAVDEARGNRWCLFRCRFRQRNTQAQRSAEETHQVYAAALTRAGWRPWRVAGCPQPGTEGIESCWRRDEYVLNLWVRAPECEVRERPEGTDGPQVEAVCPPTQVTVKVINRVAYR